MLGWPREALARNTHIIAQGKIDPFRPSYAQRVQNWLRRDSVSVLLQEWEKKICEMGARSESTSLVDWRKSQWLIIFSSFVPPIQIPIYLWVRLTKRSNSTPDFFYGKFEPPWFMFFFRFFWLVTAHIKNPVLQYPYWTQIFQKGIDNASWWNWSRPQE